MADNALVGLTLLIAESRPEDKDTLVVNLINGDNIGARATILTAAPRPLWPDASLLPPAA